MINPAQNQPSNLSASNTAVGNSPPEGKPKQTPSEKFSILFGAATVVAIILGVLLAFVIPSQKQQTSTAPQPVDYSKPKAGQPLVGVNGRILDIKKEGNKTIFKVSSYGGSWQKTWQITVGAKTILVDEKGWQANSVSGNSPIAGAQMPTNKTVGNLSVNDFKVEDIIYMMAAEGQDFQKDEIDGPETIVKLKV